MTGQYSDNDDEPLYPPARRAGPRSRSGDNQDQPIPEGLRHIRTRVPTIERVGRVERVIGNPEVPVSLSFAPHGQHP